MKENILKCIARHNEYGLVLDETTISGDYKTNHQIFKKVKKAYATINDSDDKRLAYLELMRSTTSSSILTSCCANMMKGDIEPNIARKKLEEQAVDAKIHPILAFNAKMFLSEWDKGNITKE